MDRGDPLATLGSLFLRRMEKTVEAHRQKSLDRRTVVVEPVPKSILSSTVLLFLEQGRGLIEPCPGVSVRVFSEVKGGESLPRRRGN